MMVKIGIVKSLRKNINSSTHIVKCTTCKEIFSREEKDLDNRHSCPDFMTTNGIRTKLCFSCNSYKNMNHFFNDKSYSCEDCYRLNSNCVEYVEKIDNEFIIRCEFIKLHKLAIMPSKKLPTDVGLDVYAVEDSMVEQNSVKMIPTGFALVAPVGYYYTIEGRSGFFKHNICPYRGIIDATYSGEVKIAVVNNSDVPIKISVGDRFAQLIMHKEVKFDIVEVEVIDETYSMRGERGLGSSGINDRLAEAKRPRL